MPRKKIGKLRVYKMSDSDYKAFCEFCRSMKRTPSEVIRSLMLDFYVKGLLEETKIRSLKELEKYD